MIDTIENSRIEFKVKLVDDLEEALKSINDYYIKLSGGVSRPITEFYKVNPNISFKELNNYINDLDEY